MKRPAVAGLLVAASLLAAAGADAKAPPNGVDVCGADGRCAHLTAQQIESEWALFSAIDNGIAPAPVAPFLVVRWSWGDNLPTQAGYYLPSSGMTRQTDDDGAAVWQLLEHPRTVRALTSSLKPFRAPVFTRVTVGGRAVRDPASYDTLYGRGTDAFPMILPAWIPLHFAARSASPWTDRGADIRISRQGRLLWEDGWMLRIPLRLAQQVRARQPLR